MANVQEESSPDGAAYPWILEHLLTYPGTYEIPLRTMYTLNATTQPQQHQTSGNAFPPRPHHADEAQTLNTQTAAAQLRANLMSHISQQPSQPASLPPSFVTSFVRRVFPAELELVDFPQALTALDYLKDLEIRRRREVVAALDRLGVDRNDLHEKEKLGKKYPGVLRWIIELEEKERRVEALYTQVYLGLRRWTLINEMSLQPFNKSNCLAMLNTLYPPVNSVQPTAQLTKEVLNIQRSGFFRYIQGVEKKGAKVLLALIDQGKHEDHDNGWTNVRDAVDRYLRAANAIIDECHDTIGRDNLASPTSSFSEKELEEQRNRKTDSGISFASSKRSSGRRESTSTTESAKSKSANDSSGPDKPPGSTLERIAREIRKIRSRGDFKDAMRHERRLPLSRSRGSEPSTPTMEDQPAPPSPERKLRLRPSLRSMKSTGALRERDRNITSAGSSVGNDGDLEDFDVEEMKRRRMIWEAKKNQDNPHKADEGFDSMVIEG